MECEKVRTTKRLLMLFSVLILATSLSLLTIHAQDKDSNESDKTVVEKEKKSPAKIDKKKKKTTTRKKRKRVKHFTLNFRDVEISEFLNIMSQLIGKNIIIDEKVRGKITISSAKKIPVTEAFNILKSILEVKGFAVVETRNLIKVIPIKEAVKKNVEVIVDGKKKELPEEGDKTITYLLEVQIADANEIANVLRALKSNFVDIVVYTPLNVIVLSGTVTEINGLIKIASALDKKIEEEMLEDMVGKGNIHVVHLENADAEQLANVLSRIPFSEKALIQRTLPPQIQQKIEKSKKARRVTKTQRTAPKTQPATKLSIIANKETNSLIITATVEEFREILRIIKELDIVREQVLIEALILEVSAERGWGLGIDWMLGDQTGNHLFGGSSLMGAIPDYSTPSSLSGKKIAIPLSQGFQLGYLSDRSVLGFVLLNASGTDKNFNILSTPQILTVDNQEAELNVGEEIPVPTTNRISDTGTQFYTYEYKTVGVKLKITPHITKKEKITLDFYLEVNSVLGQTTILEGGSIIPPKLGKRDFNTKVSVRDGTTIVVGGLISNNKISEETKVPGLGDIPLLGWFFKRQSVEYKKTNLLVFLTPHIVTKQKRLEAITEQKKEEQRRLRERKMGN
jgi:general secretion pathway protein D